LAGVKAWCPRGQNQVLIQLVWVRLVNGKQQTKTQGSRRDLQDVSEEDHGSGSSNNTNNTTTTTPTALTPTTAAVTDLQSTSGLISIMLS
jgi:hypothetical protein